MTIDEQVPLAPLTTLRVGGPARFFVRVHTLDELRKALVHARTHDLAVFILGGGSNIVLPDAGWDGLVIQIDLHGITYHERDDNTTVCVAAAGERWDDVVADTVARGFWGLENLSAIPGSVGATPVQNVGAYGVEVKDVIEWVEVVNTQTDALERLTPEYCQFAYRDSVFKHAEGRHYVITRVAYRLAKNGTPNLRYKDVAAYFSEQGSGTPTVAAVRKAIMFIRKKKFPDMAEVGTAGSFFQNPIISRAQYNVLRQRYRAQRERYGEIPQFPVADSLVKVPIAWFMDKVAHWRGYRRGAVGVYEHHVLALVTYEGATAHDVAALAGDLIQDMKDKTDISIEPEVTFVTTAHALHV